MPDPLHPAVVHFPIVLALLLPLLAVAAVVAIRRGVPPRAWALVVVFGGLLTLSSWAAVETGEDQEDAVEAVVSGSVIHEHEEAAEALLVGSGILLLLLMAGVAPGRIGGTARALSIPGALAVVVLAFQVGHSGGELVYEHGAAAAYVSASPAPGDGARAGHEEGRDEHRERESH